MPVIRTNTTPQISPSIPAGIRIRPEHQRGVLPGCAGERSARREDNISRRFQRQRVIISQSIGSHGKVAR
ncbi:MAG TPA: hypothetical protein PKH81_03350, partial [Treponemataceae bacterium]|nr:hypothetical protein [Treponemataceae bacterium]